MSTASQLPADARIVALLTDEAAELSRAVVDLATEIADGRGRTLVLGIGAAGEAVDESLGTSEAPGLAEVLSGEAKLTDVTHRSPERRFLYLPVGASSLPVPRAGVRWLIDRVRAANGTLLVVVPRDRGGLPAEWFDMEWEIAAPAAPSPAPAPPASMPAVPMPSDAMPEPSRWGRHRLKQSLPLARFAFAGIALIALLAGWWLLARVVTRSSAEGSLPAAAVPASAADGGVAERRAEASPQEPGGAAFAAGDDDLRDRVAAASGASAPELAYSVLVASYARPADAFRRARRLSEDGSILFFVAPTELRGRTYHRLFAGALPTRDSARALMGDLMGRGIKDAISNWDIRPTSLSYLLSAHATRDAARSAQRQLLDSGISAYTIPLVAEGDTVYQVYAGAYERSDAAAAMRALLAEAGVDAELVPRRGEPR